MGCKNRRREEEGGEKVEKKRGYGRAKMKGKKKGYLGRTLRLFKADYTNRHTNCKEVNWENRILKE